MKRHAIWFIAVVGSAAAAEPTPEHAKAVELFEQGRALMTAHHPAEACASFGKAIVLEPLAAGTMLNLGLCNEELGKYRTALYWFRKAQLRATESDPAMPAYEHEAREHAGRLATLVATIKIVLAPDAPLDVHVTVDGEPIVRDDFARLEIDPGHHVLVASAPGKAEIRHELDIAGRGGETVTLAFVAGEDGSRDTVTAAHPPAGGEPPAAIVERPAPADTGSERRTIAVYVAIGGGALLGASLGLTLYEKHVYNEFAPAAMQNDAAALANTRHATAIARDWGTGLAVAGTAAVGTAAYLYFTAPPRSDQTALVPTVARDHIGLAATGRF